MKMRFRKPELFPLVFMIGAVLLLTSLGVWQVERLQWKKTLIAQVEQVQHAPALGTLPQALDGLDYHNVALTGTFLYDKAMHMIGVPHSQLPQDNGPGFLVLTPFRLEDDGRIILVNRGFAPLNKEARPEGVQTVTGILRPTRGKRLFSPSNQPQKNVWFYEDVPAMAQYTGLQLTPLMVEATGKAQKGVWPIPSDGSISLRNDHLGYVITWFSLAIIALVMFGIYYRIPESDA